MTPAEKDAIEQGLNQFLQIVMVLAVLAWWAWWAIRKAGFSWPQEAQTAPKALTADTAPQPSIMSRSAAEQPRQTDSSPAVAESGIPPAFQLDKTRAGLVKALLVAGWSATEIRNTLRGDNVVIAQEIAAARKALEDDMLIVRDGSGERLIPR